MVQMTKENSMLLDVQYVRPNRQNGTPDYLYLIWKDLMTGEKHLTTVPEPTMDIYFEKPEYRTFTHNKNYERIEHLEKRTVKYNSIIPSIAKEMGPTGVNYLDQIYANRDWARLKDFQRWNYAFGSDYDIRSYYRIKWLKTMHNEERKPITKGFLDIEADSLHVEGFANPETCPVDLVTIIDRSSMTSYTFALTGQEYHKRDPRLLTDKQIKKEDEIARLYESRHLQEESLMSDLPGLKKELSEMFDESYGKLDYKFYFYTDERKLLAHLFQLINNLKLDFIVIWNIAFDIPFILKRMEVLGMDPKDYMCHPDFPVKECWFKKDTVNSLPKNKSDFFHCSSYTVWYDQMELYAAIRKSEKELRSNKLTDVAHDEIKDDKLDYSEDGNIKTLAYNNYRKYFIYNIKDVLLQMGIENRTSDLEMLYVSSYLNATVYEQVFKQTMKLRNVQYLSFLDQGLVPGNNVNQLNLNRKSNYVRTKEEEEDDSDDDKFEGALVGNPLLNEYFGMDLYGHPSNAVFNYSIDMDMSSFYPNTIYALNIDPSTLYFKVFCDAGQFDVRGGELPYHGITDKQIVPTNKDSFEGDIAKEVFDNFQTRAWLSIGHKWLNLPSVTDVYDACLEEFGEAA